MIEILIPKPLFDGSKFVISLSWRIIVPLFTSSRPAIILSNVVLPHPLGYY